VVSCFNSAKPKDSREVRTLGVYVNYLVTNKEIRIMLGQHYHYSSTLGTICVVPAPRLAGYDSWEDRPISVFYPDTHWGKGKRYKDLKGILVSTLEEVNPDLVVYELADGSLLGATREVLEDSTRDYHNAYQHISCVKTDVSRLQILQELPEKLDIPIFNFE